MTDFPLKSVLLETLRRSGPMTFERYMALCLYHPEFGYYTQGSERTGVAGDYFTSADLHPIFARLVARQAAEMWELLGRPQGFTFVEMGAGRGLFARDFVGWVKRARPDFAARLDYVAIEPGLKQQSRIVEQLREAGLETDVHLRANLEEIDPVTGCFFSNELVDAFPVAVVTRARGRLREVCVAVEGNQLCEKLSPPVTGGSDFWSRRAGTIGLQLSERRVPPRDPGIAAYVARYADPLVEGQRVEVNRQALQWVRAVAGKLVRGFAITVDYGDLAERLYTADRPRGTLLAYRGHQVSEEFFSAPGECDLTAHVNFSALIDAGEEVGLHFAGLVSQEQFLMALGEANEFADLYDSIEGEVEKLRARLKLKRLLSPAGMGNIFKVLIQHRGIPAQQLTGLKYRRKAGVRS
jgi:SAM-dependent MidA family methyltransferase